MTGTLGLFSLVDLFQLLAASGRTGRLAVKHPAGPARVYFEKGQVRHAEFASLEGEAALDALFADERGAFSFVTGLPAPVVTLEGSTEGLLLDLLRRADERRRDDPDDAPAPPSDAVPYAPETVRTVALPFAAFEKRVVAAVNGHWTIGRIAAELEVDELQTRQAVGRLVQVGTLKLRARRPRTAQLVVRLAPGRLPDGTVGVDAGIVRAWGVASGGDVAHVALRRADGRATVLPLVAIEGAGPYLHVPRATLLRLGLRVEDALVARPHRPEPPWTS
ncbi:MAG: DUF4388 domain-containing protein [Trueperaceae bacterium]|nr:DUF4388 domain-containing protein [Trueperaceae bacterium]